MSFDNLAKSPDQLKMRWLILLATISLLTNLLLAFSVVALWYETYSKIIGLWALVGLLSATMIVILHVVGNMIRLYKNCIIPIYKYFTR